MLAWILFPALGLPAATVIGIAAGTEQGLSDSGSIALVATVLMAGATPVLLAIVDRIARPTDPRTLQLCGVMCAALVWYAASAAYVHVRPLVPQRHADVMQTLGDPQLALSTMWRDETRSWRVRLGRSRGSYDFAADGLGLLTYRAVEMLLILGAGAWLSRRLVRGAQYCRECLRWEELHDCFPIRAPSELEEFVVFVKRIPALELEAGDGPLARGQTLTVTLWRCRACGFESAFRIEHKAPRWKSRVVRVSDCERERAEILREQYG